LSKRKRKKKKYKSIGSGFNINPENRHINSPSTNNRNDRGMQVYTLSGLMNFSGEAKNNNYISVTSDNPYFALTPQERNLIFQLSSPVFGVVSSRMNRVAGLDFEVIAESYVEDEKAEYFKNMYNIIKEYEGINSLESLVVISIIKNKLFNELKTLRPDLKNFNNALLRWKKRIQMTNQLEANDLKEWLCQPNPIESWHDFVKVWVYDLMIHGSNCIYKSKVNNKINNIQHLAGGTVIPIRTPYVDASEAYIQVANYKFQIFFRDEVTYSKYIPVSWRSYSMIPLESLINKITETLFFDKLMADQADGTRPPEKMVLVTENKTLSSDVDLDLPMNNSEQKRLEEKLNQPIKNRIMTFNGNNAEVIDLSRENTMEFQHARQKDIREEVALVFNMTNMEVNLSGSDNTSGRSTSEVQREIEQGKGIAPIIKSIEQTINSDILPFRAQKDGYFFKFNVEDSENKKIENLTKKLNSGLFSVNEIRITDLNEAPFEDELYNSPDKYRYNQDRLSEERYLRSEDDI